MELRNHRMDTYCNTKSQTIQDYCQNSPLLKPRSPISEPHDFSPETPDFALYRRRDNLLRNHAVCCARVIRIRLCPLQTHAAC